MRNICSAGSRSSRSMPSRASAVVVSSASVRGAVVLSDTSSVGLGSGFARRGSEFVAGHWWASVGLPRSSCGRVADDRSDGQSCNDRRRDAGTVGWPRTWPSHDGGRWIDVARSFLHWDLLRSPRGCARISRRTSSTRVNEAGDGNRPRARFRSSPSRDCPTKSKTNRRHIAWSTSTPPAITHFGSPLSAM